MSLDRGWVEITIDDAWETVTLVHRRSIAHVVPPEVLAPVAFVLGGGSLLVALMASLAILGETSLPYGVAFVGTVLALGLLVLSEQFDTFRPVRLDLKAGFIQVGATRLPLRLTRMKRSQSGWSLQHASREVHLGAAWGPAGASWLMQTLHFARAGQLEQIELTDPRHARPPKLPPRAVDFTVDQGGVQGLLQPFEDDLSQPRLRLFVGLISMGILALIGWAYVRPSTACLFMGYGVAFGVEHGVVLWRRHRAQRLGHTRVRLDSHALHYVERGQVHRLALADVAAVHVGHRAVQVDLHDGTVRTVGHGWASDALERLVTELRSARARPAAVTAMDLPPVPPDLALLRQTTR